MSGLEKFFGDLPIKMNNLAKVAIAVIALLCLFACGGHTPVPPPPPPPVKHGIIVTITESTGSPAVNHYLIFRGPNCTALVQLISTVSAQYVDSSAVPGQPYCYGAKAVGANGGVSPMSNPVMANWTTSSGEDPGVVVEAQ